MKSKAIQRYGMHDFTTVEASSPEETRTMKHEIIAWQSENEIAELHAQVRRAIRDTIRDLQDADTRLEHNVMSDPDINPRRLLVGVNSLGIVQSRALDIDGGIRALQAAIGAHSLLREALQAAPKE